MIIKRCLSLILAFLLLPAVRPLFPAARAEDAATFTDTRFQHVYTTENLDAIMEEYELIDGWFWVTRANVVQDYHGHENTLGWTETSQRLIDPYYYTPGWYGCRWNWDIVDPNIPNAAGWGECFGFAQFIGYLLSGSRNPHGEWVSFRFVNEAKGLKVGDIVRVEYTDETGFHQHSAVVYSVEGNKVKYLQVSGGARNKMRLRTGYMGGSDAGSTLVSDVYNFKGLRILRAEENLDGVYPWDWPHGPAGK